MGLEPETTVKVCTKRPSEYLSEQSSPMGALVLKGVSLNSFKQKTRYLHLAGIIIEAIPKMQHEVLEPPATSASLNEISEQCNFTNIQLDQHLICGARFMYRRWPPHFTGEVQP
jgi:hypothetical protein